jgi:hypothetical protein
MATFDPTMTVVVHEASHDVEVEWVPVTAKEWSEKAQWTDKTRSAVRWGVDCWWLARGDEVHSDAA